MIFVSIIIWLLAAYGAWKLIDSFVQKLPDKKQKQDGGAE